jgi:hypothetical protein
MEDEDRILGEGEVLVVCKDIKFPCVNNLVCNSFMIYDEQNRGCAIPFITTWSTYLINKNCLDRVK